MTKTLTASILLLVSTLSLADMNQDLLAIQKAWAVANYQTPESRQESAFESLEKRARQLVERYPDRAEPRIWLAISLSTDAGVNGGLSALGKVKEARKLLEEAEKIDPEALHGSIYTSLGSLYYKVPGWPLAFGNDDKARRYLQKALAINPAGIDPNYFYGDFLISQDHPKEAIEYLRRARQAPPRPDRPIADAGRRREIAAALRKAQGMLE